jgi:hypothetical protein
MSRNRSRFRTENRQMSKLLYTGDPSPVLLATKTYTEFESMTDELSPGYPFKDGVFPINPLSYVCSIDAEASGQLVWRYNNIPNWVIIEGNCLQMLSSNITGWSALNPSIPGFIISDWQALARNDCLARMDNPEYSFAEPLAEVGKTLRTIKQPLRALKRIISSFARKRHQYNDFRRTHIAAEQLSDLWLSHSLNAGPNIRTVTDAIDAFASRSIVKGFAKIRKVSATHEQSRVGTATSLADTFNFTRSGFSGVSWAADRRNTLHRTFLVTAALYYKSLDDNTEASYLGLRARDLPGLAWDLVPLSFMIDRLWNVSRFIKISSSLLSSRVRVLSGYETYRQTDRLTRKVSNIIRTTSNVYNTASNCRPTDTPSWSTTTFSFGRSRWKPTAFDALPPNRAGKLLGSLSSTADAVSLMIKRLS